MTDGYTEADYLRDLGIPNWADYDTENARISEGRGTGDPAWAEYDAELERIKSGRTKLDDLFDKSLGINVSESEAAKARGQLAEAEEHPWRIEWPASERLSRRGEEAHLAELYSSRLGESASVAQAHVHRELSAAWEAHRYTSAQLDAVENRLRSERQRMEAKAPLHESKGTAPKVIRGSRGHEFVVVEEVVRPDGQRRKR